MYHTNNSTSSPDITGHSTTIQTTPEDLIQAGKELEAQDFLTVFIPNNLDIDLMLEQSPPTFKFHKDEFLYILDLITQIPSKQKQRNNELINPYVSLSSSLLQRRTRNYRSILSYLVENDVLEEDSQYIIGSKSKSFAFTNRYVTEVTTKRITNKKLIRKIVKFYDYTGGSNYYIDASKNDYQYILTWFNEKLKVDFKSAKQYLNELYQRDLESLLNNIKINKMCIDKGIDFEGYCRKIAMLKYNSRLRPLVKLHKGLFTSSIDSTAGRLHSVLTQLKSELRQFVTFDNQPLVAVDIVNSQPFLSTSLLNIDLFSKNEMLKRVKLYNPNLINNNSNNNSPNNPIMLAKTIKEVQQAKNVRQYIDFVRNGEFYEEFGELLSKTGILKGVEKRELRKKAKIATFASIFSPNELFGLPEVKAFRSIFPDVSRVFSIIKSSKGNHRALACSLQNLEADLILHKACKKISQNNPEIPLFTLHDSIITIPKYVSHVRSVMNDVLTDAIGFSPKLKIEEWKKVA